MFNKRNFILFKSSALTVPLLIISIVLGLFPHPSSDRGTDTEVFLEVAKPTVIIDAGHGGEDSGAIGTGGAFEKDINFEIAMKLGEYLRSSGHEIVYTRTEDKLLYKEEENIKGMRKIYDLKNRMLIGNSYDNAIFISIHMNSFGDERCSGLQIYYSDSGEALAKSVEASVRSNLQPTNKRVSKSGEGLYVLENSNNPAILIECGFISNPDEYKKLLEKEYQKELCFAILCGIIEYERSMNQKQEV